MFQMGSFAIGTLATAATSLIVMSLVTSGHAAIGKCFNFIEPLDSVCLVFILSILSLSCSHSLLPYTCNTTCLLSNGDNSNARIANAARSFVFFYFFSPSQLIRCTYNCITVHYRRVAITIVGQ